MKRSPLGRRQSNKHLSFLPEEARQHGFSDLGFFEWARTGYRRQRILAGVQRPSHVWTIVSSALEPEQVTVHPILPLRISAHRAVIERPLDAGNRSRVGQSLTKPTARTWLSGNKI